MVVVVSAAVVDGAVVLAGAVVVVAATVVEVVGAAVHTGAKSTPWTPSTEWAIARAAATSRSPDAHDTSASCPVNRTEVSNPPARNARRTLVARSRSTCGTVRITPIPNSANTAVSSTSIPPRRLGDELPRRRM